MRYIEKNIVCLRERERLPRGPLYGSVFERDVNDHVFDNDFDPKVTGNLVKRFVLNARSSGQREGFEPRMSRFYYNALTH